MKPRRSFLMGACLLLNASWVGTSPLLAQTPAPAPPPATALAPQTDDLEQLVAPIALYPDALVALILPAATESSDVVLAARYLDGGGDVAQVQSQPWDDSVKGLAHYPEVVKWMDENLAWTRQIGDAYLEKPAEVMAAVQRARTRAQANGVLVSTTQQQVVTEGGYIRIVPAQPDVIYVPRYDPQIIYVDRPIYHRSDPWLTFGVGFGVGSWLNYDCDWRRRVIVVDHDHRHHWRDRHDWRHRRFADRSDRFHTWRPWAPRPDRARHPRDHFSRRHHDIVRPGPIVGAPHFDRHRRDFDRHRRDGRRDRPHDRITGPQRSDRRGGAQFTRPHERRPDAPHAAVTPPNHTADPSAAGTPPVRRLRPNLGDATPRDRRSHFDRQREARVQRGPNSAERANPPQMTPRPGRSHTPGINNPSAQPRPRHFASSPPRELSPRAQPPAASPAARPAIQAPRVAQPARSAPVAQVPRAGEPARSAPAPHREIQPERSNRAEHASRPRVEHARGRNRGERDR